MLINENIKLKLIEEDDLSYIVEWRNLMYKNFYEYPLSNATQKKWFEKYLKNKDIIFIIYEKEYDKRLGMVGLSKIDYRNRNAELGQFLLIESLRGKGYGKTSLFLILEYAFNHLNLHKIYLNVLNNNTKAINLYKSLYFEQEGIKKDHIYKNGQYYDIVMMSILKKFFNNITI